MYQSLHATSQTLASFLENQIKADPFLASPGRPFLDRGMHVLLNTPQEMMDNDDEGISLWLYRVVCDESRRNDPAKRVSATQLKPPPLPLRLHYLVTPITTRDHDGDPDTEQYLLGKVMQLFHTKPLFFGADLQGELTGTSAELQITMDTMSLDDITRVWDALEGSYQLSVSYQVGIVDIDSANEPDGVTPVLVVLPQFGQASLKVLTP
jgi:hypothetical protein